MYTHILLYMYVCVLGILCIIIHINDTNHDQNTNITINIIR